MKNVTLTIKEIQINADGTGVIVTNKSADNPSATGVFKQSSGQLARLATRCGAPNAFVLKLLVQTGGSTMSMDVENVKAGDTYIKKDGEEGVYGKDFPKNTNESIALSTRATNQLIDVAMRQAIAQPSAPVASADKGDDDMPF